MSPSSATVLPTASRTFDEETCRYLLREIGEQIVPFYPFSFGIDEVYAILLERYGESSIADALSVLHELMEDDDNANGMGDDGDIWRSWRHSWRHRNDSSNSHNPTVCGIVLPPPTSPDSRRAKTTAFSTNTSVKPTQESTEYSEDVLPSAIYQEIPSPHGIRSLDNSDTREFSDTTRCDNKELFQRTVRFKLPNVEITSGPSSNLGAGSPTENNSTYRHNEGTSVAHRNYGEEETEALMDSDGDTLDSQQDFEEVRSSADSTDFDPSQLIAFEMLTPFSGLKGGDSEIKRFRPVTRRARNSESPLSVKHQKRISQRASCQVSNLPLEQSCRLNQFKQVNVNQPLQPINSFLTSPGDSETLRLNPRLSKEATASIKPNELQGSPRTACAAENSDLDMRASPHLLTPRKGASNRHARLIDGSIFTTAHHKRGNRPTYRDESRLSQSATESAPGIGLSGLRQKEPLRHSLIQGVRSIFRKDQQSHQQQSLSPDNPHQKHKRQSSMLHETVDRGYDMVLPKLRTASPISDLSPATGFQAQSWGLDGASDYVSAPSLSPPNLNKALPASPGNLGLSKSSSTHTGTPSFERSQDNRIRPSTSSSVSSSVSTKSSKRDFRGMTRALINEDTTARKPDLSPVREAETLPPSAYDPRKSMQSSVYSNHSYKDSAHKNPFTEDPFPLTPGIPMPLSVCKKENSVIPPDQFRVPVPESSPNMQFSSPNNDLPCQPVRRSPTPARYDIETGQITFKADQTSRGRAPRRPIPPMQPADIPRTDPKVQKRSRSPVKKLFGIGKSTSLKDISGEPRSRSKSASPDKDKTTPLRTWGNRLRHGFTVQDPESTAGPDEMSTPPEKGTPFTTPQSTFPISLDPPYQAKVLSEMELMICVTANRFLMDEFTAGHISQDSIVKVKRSWANKNRPQVLEFSYDQITQRDLIILNVNTVRFHGECARDDKALKTTLTDWKVLANEIAIRTFCFGDSAIRKYMHDSYKILEMLGAPPTTFFAFQNLQLKSLDKIKDKQRERMERNREQETPSKKKSATVGRRNLTPGPLFGHTPKGSLGSIEANPSPGFGQAYDAFENSRGGRLGKMMYMAHEHQG